MPKTIVLLNGPPGSGKDAGAEALCNLLDFQLERFSMPLKRSLAAFLDTPWKTLDKGKDEPSKFIPNGRTFREAQISLSEEWGKQFFGQGVFGNLLARRIAGDPGVERWVIADCGFYNEVYALMAALPDTHFILLHVTRPGHTFARDSRGYVQGSGLQDEFGCVGLERVLNTGMLAGYQENLVRVVRDWILQFEPQAPEVTICATKNCAARATVTVHWPGQSVSMCKPCSEHAASVAEAMGFEVALEALA